jgi:hypothetical protein
MSHREEFLAQYGHVGHIDNTVLDHKNDHLVTENPALNSDHVSKILSRDTDTNTMTELAKKSDILTKDHINKMVNHKDVNFVEAIAQHGHLEPHHVEKLLKDGIGVRSSLAMNPHLQKHHIDTLSNDENDWVKMAVTANKSATGQQKEHAASGITDPRKVATINARRELGWFK